MTGPIAEQVRDFRVQVRARASEHPLLESRRRVLRRLAALAVGIGGPLLIAGLRDGVSIRSDRFGLVLLYLLPVIAATMLGGYVASVSSVVSSSVVIVYAHLSMGSTRWPAADELTPVIIYAVVGLILSHSLSRERVGRARLQAVQERLAFIARASELLGETALDLRRTLTELGKVTVPHLADLCVVDVVEEDGRITTVVVAHGPSVDPARAENLLTQPAPDVRHAAGVPAVVRTGEPEVYPRVDEQTLEQVATNPMHQNLLVGLGIKSMMVVPLRSPHRVFGAMTLAMISQSVRYTDAELALAEDVAARAGTALDNVVLYHERSREATMLQQSLLPASIPEIPGMEVEVRFRPQGRTTLVGGDFYDVFQIDERTWGFAVGDVCGKGIEAAALTGLARHTIRIAALRERLPSRVLKMLNEALLLQGSDRYCTAAYGRLVVEADGRATFTTSAGGHPLPIVLRANGTTQESGAPGTLLGIFDDPDLTDRTIGVEPGDTILMYTDGLLDERHDAPESELMALLRRNAGADPDALAEAIEQDAAVREPAPDDDVAFVVLRMTPQRTIRLGAARIPGNFAEEVRGGVRH